MSIVIRRNKFGRFQHPDFPFVISEKGQIYGRQLATRLVIPLCVKDQLLCTNLKLDFTIIQDYKNIPHILEYKDCEICYENNMLGNNCCSNSICVFCLDKLMKSLKNNYIKCPFCKKNMGYKHPIYWMVSITEVLEQKVFCGEMENDFLKPPKDYIILNKK